MSVRKGGDVMNSDEQKAFGLGVFIATVLILAVALLHSFASDNEWKSQAIQHGAAEYDSATGAFRWKDGK